MSDRFSASGARALPDRPSLEHLKNHARRRQHELRARSGSAKLTEAQLQVARDYGFASWRQLKAFVESRGGPAQPFANLTGFYRHDPRFVTNGVVAISAEGGRLFFEGVNGARFELSDQGRGRFAIAGLEDHYMFEGAEDGPATALVSHTRAGAVRLERIGAAEAQAIRAAAKEAQAEQSRPRTAIPVPPDILQRYAGHYASPLGPALEVVCQNGALLVQLVGQPQLEVFPESETCFFYRVVPVQLSFVIEAGRVAAAILHQNGLQRRMDTVSAEVVERSAARIRDKLAEQERPRALTTIDPEVLRRYVGSYQLDAARTLTVTAEDERLFIEISGQRRYEVYPESDHVFFWTVVAAQISFVTDPAGRVTHAVLHQNGRDAPLARINERTRT